MSSMTSIFNVTLTSLGTQAQSIAHMQEQSSSGSRLIHASDDPGDAYQVLAMLNQVSSLSTYCKNIDQVSLDLDQASTSMQDISTNLSKIKQLLVQAANSTYGAANRKTMGEEVDSILEQIVSSANVSNQGRYLFGGDTVNVVPYEVQRTNGRITAVTYQGSSQDMKIPVAPGVEQAGIVAGDRIFSGDNRQIPTFMGDTGAKPAVGTSNVRGDVWMQVTHLATTYSGVTGVTAGTSSAAGDTILGNGHKLRINFDNKTVSLDSGTAVAFTAGDTDLAVTNADGEKVYLDMSAIDGSLTGETELTIQSSGRMSIDGGATTQNINFAASRQAVTDGETGKVLYVDGSGITRTGTEPVSIGGTHDLFETLIQVRDLMLNTQNLSAEQQTNLLDKAVAGLDEVTANVTNGMTGIGGKLNGVDMLKTSLDNLKTNTQTQADSLQDADIAQLAVELSRAQTFYQMTLASAAKTMNISLLDYMQ